VKRFGLDGAEIINNTQYKRLYLLLFWFAPLLINISSGRLAASNLDHIIVYALFLTELFGLIYIFFILRRPAISIYVLIIMTLLFTSMLYSDIREIKLVLALFNYSLIVHVISKRFSFQIWSQYYLICLIISWMTIIEIFYYFIFGDFLFSFRSPELIKGIFPRVTPVFDEMSHQSFFLMPAAIIAFQKHRMQFYILFLGILLTFSAHAIVLFIPLLVYFNASYFKFNLKKILYFSVIILTFIAVLFLAFDFIADKLGSIVNPDSLTLTKSVSALNLLIAIDLLRDVELYKWLIGFGYFNPSDELSLYLVNSPLYEYYSSINLFDKEVNSIGILNMFIYFGAIIVTLVLYLLFKAKKYAIDKRLFVIAIFVVIASMAKNSHTVDYFVHLFFIFGLSYCVSDKLLYKKKEGTNVDN